MGHDTNKELAKLYGDLSLLFMALLLTIWELNDRAILIVILAITSIFIVLVISNSSKKHVYTVIHSQRKDRSGKETVF